MINFLKKVDLFLLIPAILLTALGLLMIYSTSFESDPSFFTRQLIYALVSIIIFILVSQINFKDIIQFVPVFYIFIILLLLLTLFLDIETRGSVRWIDLKVVTLQGSELAKPVIILGLAYFFSKYPLNLKIFSISLILIAVPVFLIIRQPDLSNSLILLLIWAFMIFIAGANLIFLISSSAAFLISAPFVWNFFLKDYQKERVLAFLNLKSDPQGTSYNIVQSLIAFGSGQVTGTGIGRGTQSQLNFLPENRTDFIFAAAGEELGFIGISLIIMVFAFLLFRILMIARLLKSGESALFVYGGAAALILQFFINAGMNIGIFPVSGVTLPFVSFGGSSLISMYLLLGLIQSAKRQSN